MRENTGPVWYWAGATVTNAKTSSLNPDRGEERNWAAWVHALFPSIVFYHMCQFNDVLALLVLLTRLKGMFLEKIIRAHDKSKLTLLKIIFSLTASLTR